MSEREWLEGLRPEDRDPVPARRPEDPVLDALDRLVDWASWRIDRPSVELIAATVRDALERHREERDEYPPGTTRLEIALTEALQAAEAEAELLRGARRYLQEEVDVQATLAVTRDISRRQYVERARRLTEGLRDLLDNGGWGHSHWDPTGQHGAGCSTCITQREARDRARALLSANPPQGDAAAFCEHGYTTEDSSHPSAGLERCPTCSPSDGGGA